MKTFRNISAILLATCITANALPNVPVDFEKQILPIFAEKCFKCHSSLTKKPKGDLKMDDVKSLMASIGEKEAIIPGNPEDSDLFWALTLPAGDDDLMPPEKENTPTTQRERDLIEKWIEQGASLGDFKEYKHNEETIALDVSGSEARDTQAAARKIDTLVAAALEKAGKKINDPVGDEIFLRRTYLNIIGQNPTFEEARLFLSSEAEGKREKLIDILLESDGYVSHASNYWGDALRAQARDGSYDAEPYLVWLKQSLKENTPYDEFVRDLLATEGRFWDKPQLGFYFRDRKNRLAGVEAVSTLFLGTQIGCAQRHDHPYDKWTQKDYYSFAAFYDARTGFIPRHKYLETVDGSEMNNQRLAINDYLRRKKLAEKMEKRGEDSGDLRTGIPKLKGVSPETLETLVKKGENPEFLAYASGLLVNRVAQGMYFPHEKPWGELPENYLYDDGKPGQKIPPHVLFGETPPVEYGDDLAPVLADWITSPENPRFTKVIANRLWEWMMGYPLSGPVDEVVELHRSADPDLVLYLEGLMRATGYDMKQFLRILANTETYQRAATSETFEPLHPEILSGSRLTRLSAEEIWDSLAVIVNADIDDHISLEMPDQSLIRDLYTASSPDDYWKKVIASYDKMKEEGGVSTHVPLMVLMNERKERKEAGLEDKFIRASEVGQPAPGGHFLRLFGQSDRELMDNSWANPTVPQALTLLNGPFHATLADPESAFSKLVDDQDTTVEKISATFVSILGRLPGRVETNAATNFVHDRSAENPYADLAWALINTRQFLFKN